MAVCIKTGWSIEYVETLLPSEQLRLLEISMQLDPLVTTKPMRENNEQDLIEMEQILSDKDKWEASNEVTNLET